MRGPWLPDDIWYIVWDSLPMDDRLAVSRVCKYWRSLALSSPRLWSELDFFDTSHGADCECETCEGMRRYDIGCHNCCGEEVGSTNLRTIRELLSRSLQVPLSLSITVIEDNGFDSHSAWHLLHALKPHAARIQRLSFSDASSQYIAEFFAAFPSLPALTSCTSDQDNLQFVKPIDLPSLQRLKTSDRLYHSGNRNSGLLSFPAVTYLDFVPNLLTHFEWMLEAVPNATTLRLSVHYPLDTTAQNVQRVRDLASKIEHVHICGSRTRYDDHLLAIFRDPRRQTLTFDYSVDAAESAPGALNILADLEPPDIELSISSIPKEYSTCTWVTLAGTDSRGLRRSVGCPVTAVEQAWKHLSPASASALSIDAALCSSLVQPGAFPACASARRLTLDLTDNRFVETREPDSTPCFPALSTLVLRKRDGPQGRVTIAHLIAVVHQLRGKDDPLQELVLQHVEIEGDPDCLRNIAKTLTRHERAV